MSSPLRTVLLVCVLVAALLLAAGCTQQSASPVKTETATGTIPSTPVITIAATIPAAPAAVSAEPWKRIRLSTNMGDIVIALNPDMPITSGNFQALVNKGFYNNVTFHRVIDGFMLQGGDPTGTGRGGPGYTIKDEFGASNRNDRGTISMANSGPNTGGSQFFINLVNNNYLDTKHPVFGKVVEGMDVVDKIGKIKTGAGDRPLLNVTILKADII